MDFDKCPCSGRTLARLLQPAILSVLAEGPLHGYPLAQRLGSMAMFESATPDFAGIYRTLAHMEEQALIRGEWELPEAGPAKRAYRLTRSGRACLAQWLETLEKYRTAIDQLTAHIRERLA